MPVRQPLNPQRASKEPVGFTRQIRASHLGIRHPIHLGNNLVPGIRLSNKEVTKGSTGTMMVTRLWRGPGTPRLEHLVSEGALRSRLGPRQLPAHDVRNKLDRIYLSELLEGQGPPGPACFGDAGIVLGIVMVH